MCFPKIDDSPPQGEWACLKMHEVMRPSFLLPLSLSLSLSLFFSDGGSHLWKEASQQSQAVRGHLQITQPSPLPAPVRMAERDIWRSAGRQCDKWCRWGPATHKQTKEAGSRRYDNAPNGHGRGRMVAGAQCGGESWKTSLKGKLLFTLPFLYKATVMQNCSKRRSSASVFKWLMTWRLKLSKGPDF